MLLALLALLGLNVQVILTIRQHVPVVGTVYLEKVHVQFAQLVVSVRTLPQVQ